jgi:predicted dehydrogenase
MSAFSALSASRVSGANDRVRVGLIGCGGQGSGDWRNFLAQSDVSPVAVCDVYDPFRERAAQMCKEKVDQYKDFRRMLERSDVDAVIVATPDHWHALLTIMACKAGKDVYVEKPLSHSLREGRVMVDTARKYKRVVQVGAQQRSGEHYAKAIGLIRDGTIGAVHSVSAYWTRNMMPGFKPRELKSGLTSALDWDLWLGPAPAVPFDPLRFAYNWRWFWDYSGGQMTNWGAHSLDIVRWALDAKAPSAVAAFGGRYELKDGGETPDVQQAIYSFPGCVVTWNGCEISGFEPIRYPEGDPRIKPLIEFHGTKGSMVLTRRGFWVTPQIWTGDGADHETPAMQPLTAAATGFPHARNFLDCVKSRKRPIADVEEGHLTVAMCHLGNMATKLSRTLRWDAEKEEVIGDSEANRLLSISYRKPWTLS